MLRAVTFSAERPTFLERHVAPRNKAAASKRSTADAILEAAERLCATHGIEATLQQLYDAGVYVTFEEYKGRKPMVRGDFVLPVTSADIIMTPKRSIPACTRTSTAPSPT